MLAISNFSWAQTSKDCSPDSGTGLYYVVIPTQLTASFTTLGTNIAALLSKKWRVGTGIAGMLVSTGTAFVPFIVTGFETTGCHVSLGTNFGFALLNLPLFALSLSTMMMGINPKTGALTGIVSGISTSVIALGSMITMMALGFDPNISVIFSVPVFMAGFGVFLSSLLTLTKLSRKKNQKLRISPWVAPGITQQGLQGGIQIFGIF
jgi:hypothetical protein